MLTNDVFVAGVQTIMVPLTVIMVAAVWFLLTEVIEAFLGLLRVFGVIDRRPRVVVDHDGVNRHAL